MAIVSIKWHSPNEGGIATTTSDGVDYYDKELTWYAIGQRAPRYPVPALRRDVVYWDMRGISINTVGECEASYVYGKCCGYGVRLNYWEP